MTDLSIVLRVFRRRTSPSRRYKRKTLCQVDIYSGTDATALTVTYHALPSLLPSQLGRLIFQPLTLRLPADRSGNGATSSINESFTV